MFVRGPAMVLEGTAFEIVMVIMIKPGLWTDLIGFGLLALVLIIQLPWRNKLAAATL